MVAPCCFWVAVPPAGLEVIPAAQRFLLSRRGWDKLSGDHRLTYRNDYILERRLPAVPRSTWFGAEQMDRSCCVGDVPGRRGIQPPDPGAAWWPVQPK